MVALLPPTAPDTELTPASPGASAQVRVEGKPLGTISKDLFGANLLWPFNGDGAFDVATDSFYPGFVRGLKKLGVTMLRYPGGTTADNFHWERAIGPQWARSDNEPYGMQGDALSQVCCVVDRPVPSTVGPDEYGRLLGKLGATGNIVVNFATGSVRQAADFVAYMTAPLQRHPSTNPADPGYWGALRARNGHPAPYDVRYWEVGNEQLFPGQYGWRSGTFVSFSHRGTHCPPGQVATCLYAFGGTTRFNAQPVGGRANTLPPATRSNGTAHQTFYVYYPPVVPKSETVMVNGLAWKPVPSIGSAPRGAHVYEFSPARGSITFGDGAHGAIPPSGSIVTASYSSGPHGGFIDFYKAMKRMNPKIRVCESEETNVAFLALLGRKYPYDCVELHEYAAPKNVNSPIAQYMGHLMSYPAKEGAAWAALQREVKLYSGRKIPVYLTEYGQLVWPVPARAPQFLLSIDEALLIAAQLREWALRGVSVAEKYLATSSPFLVGDPRRVSVDSIVNVVREREGFIDWDPGLSMDSAMLAGPGPDFVTEPTGDVLGLVSQFAGTRLVASKVIGSPVLPGATDQPALLSLAAIGKSRGLLLVINADQSKTLRTSVARAPLGRASRVQVSVLDGPSGLAFNNRSDPRVVHVASRTTSIRQATFTWSFPPHSITLFRF